MILKNKDVSYDSSKKLNKKYSRKLYWCKDDDIWVNIETPISKK